MSGPAKEFRAATKCSFCGKRLPKRVSDRFADIHAKCAALEMAASAKAGGK
jgi:hypothetical protein